MAPVAKEFDKIIKDGRERKKNEALASRIFSKGRRQSAPSKLKATAGASLASRVGVRKIPQRAITSGRRASVPAGNVNGEWTHDLHHTVNTKKNTPSSSLGARITQPGSNATLSKRAASRKAAAAASAMNLDATNISSVKGKAAKNQVNVVAAPQGISIRGLAGPFAVMGQNFAPGTTPADVESAMTPIGGEMISCQVVKTQPFLMMEMVFASREGAERVIETFNDKTADGRILKVYPKVGGYQPTTGGQKQKGQQQRSGQVVDGTMGFAGGDVMQTVSGNHASKQGGGGDLFSDKMIAGGKRGGSRGGRRGGRF